MFCKYNLNLWKRQISVFKLCFFYTSPDIDKQTEMVYLSENERFPTDFIRLCGLLPALLLSHSTLCQRVQSCQSVVKSCRISPGYIYRYGMKGIECRCGRTCLQSLMTEIFVYAICLMMLSMYCNDGAQSQECSFSSLIDMNEGSQSAVSSLCIIVLK